MIAAALVLSGWAATADAQVQPHATRAVPTCPGIGVPSNGPRMLQDEHGGAESELARGINALICSAADGATIDIKSWFMTAPGAAMGRMVAALRLMHSHHHVRVNVVVGKSWYSSQKWQLFRRAFSFATVWSCARACMSGLPGSIDHSKWITVSRLRSRNGGGTAVLSTSLNPTAEQFSSGQSGIAIFRDPTVYGPFLQEWNAYVRCAVGRGCTHAIPTGRWQGRYRTQVWFEPSRLDPTHEALKTLSCRRGGRIGVMSLYLYRRPVLDDLLRLRGQGCSVDVLLEHWDSTQPAPWKQLHPRCAFNHDKMVLIDVGSTHQVIAGSQDQLSTELLHDDNQMVRTTSSTVVRRYRQYFEHGWAASSARACASVRYAGATPALDS